MALIEINFLQKQQSLLSRAKQANTVVAIVAGTLVGAQLLVLVFLFTTTKVRQGQMNTAIASRQAAEEEIKQLDKDSTSPIYPGLSLSDQAKSYQSQLESAKTLVDNHKYFTLYLSEIAINTPPSVVYASFAATGTNKLTVVGKADSYGDVSKITESFNKLSFAKSASIQDAKLDPSQVGKGLAVGFTMTIELKPASELKNRKPEEQQGAITASPRPSPRVSPSVEPSPGAGVRP